jgi:hypothetical protein
MPCEPPVTITVFGPLATSRLLSMLHHAACEYKHTGVPGILGDLDSEDWGGLLIGLSRCGGHSGDHAGDHACQRYN